MVAFSMPQEEFPQITLWSLLVNVILYIPQSVAPVKTALGSQWRHSVEPACTCSSSFFPPLSRRFSVHFGHVWGSQEALGGCVKNTGSLE